MKINLKQNFEDNYGDKLPSPNKKNEYLTLGDVVTTTLLNVLEEDSKLDAEKKRNLGDIWYDKIRGKKEADLTAEEIVIIQERLAKIQPQMILTQAHRMLEGKKL